jgi:hypothetical protein
MIGLESQSGKGAERSVLEEGVSGEGYACKRRWERVFQRGSGAVLICEAIGIGQAMR